MCLIAFAYKKHPAYKLILAANRDEFFNRPAETAGLRNDILSGIDLLAGGTWLGVHTSGRIAALTNYRDLKNIRKDAPSRGELVMDFLNANISPRNYFEQITPMSNNYNGFNMIAFDRDSAAYFGNKGKLLPLQPANIYGLSNALLDTPWRKTERSKKQLLQIVSEQEIDEAAILQMLKDKTAAEDSELPDTGVGLELERILSPVFINTKGYGTRCSSIVLWGNDGVIRFREVTYDEKGRQTNDFIMEIKT